MSSREDMFIWIILIAPLGMGLGFIFAPHNHIAQAFGAFLGAVLFTTGVCMISWLIKKKHCSHSEKKS